MQKYSNCTQNILKASNQKNSKLPAVIPSILDLIIKLNHFKEIQPEFVKNLKQDLIKRTACIIDPTDVKLNPIFGVATYLDPSNMQYLKVILPDLPTLPELDTYLEINLKSLLSTP